MTGQEGEAFNLVMRDLRAEQFLWARGLLFLSTFALTLTIPFQEGQDHECDKECFSMIQSVKAFFSLAMAVAYGMTTDIVHPEQVMVFAAVINLMVNLMAISTSCDFGLIVLSIFTSSSTNQSYVLQRALFSQTWNPELTDVEKAHVFGQLGSILSLSCIVGPLVGACMFIKFADTLYTTSTVLLFCVYLAHQLSVASGEVRSQLLPPPTAKAVINTPNKFSFKALKQTFLSSEVLLLLILKFCMVFSYGLFLPVWRDILMHTFHFTPQNHSVYLVLTATVYAFCQRFMATRIWKAAGDHHHYLLVLCAFILSVGRVFIVHTSSLVVVSGLMLCLIAALVTTNTLLAVACTNLSQPEYIGSVYSMLDFTESLAGIVSPLVGSILLQNEVYAILTGVCVTYLCFSLLVLKFYKRFFTSSQEVKKRVTEMEMILPKKQKISKVAVRATKKHKRTRSPTSVLFFRDDADNLVKLCGGGSSGVRNLAMVENKKEK